MYSVQLLWKNILYGKKYAKSFSFFVKANILNLWEKKIEHDQSWKTEADLIARVMQEIHENPKAS